jgi:WhiB family redox-sensing transcriptional regulator
VYVDGLCQHHYWLQQQDALLAELSAHQPKHPDELPVRPRRVQWLRAGWAVWMPLPTAHDGQPCRQHPDDFFPAEHDRAGMTGMKVARARESCIACPDRVPCAEYGIAHSRDYGVWGGTTPEERRRILKIRGQVFVDLHGGWVYDRRAQLEEEAS